MAYIRVIPRDLFNEAKLLKCMGKLYIEAERQPEGTIVMEHNGSPFYVKQDASNGSIYVANIDVFVNGIRVHLYTTLNARADLPLYFDFRDETESVYTDDGRLSDAFLRIGT